MQCDARPLLALGLAIVAACGDEDVDEGTPFAGTFEASDGTVIDLQAGGRATVRTVGAAPLRAELDVGDLYLIGMIERDEPGTFDRGHAIMVSGLLELGAVVRITDTEMMIERPAAGVIPTQTSWTKIGGGGGPSVSCSGWASDVCTTTNTDTRGRCESVGGIPVGVHCRD
jgi:hypothetical protein